MAASKGSVALYKELLKEFRRIHGKNRYREQPAFSYLVDQFQKHKGTTERLCRGRDEMHHMGQTYLCLLQSLRKQEELSQQYKGHGERSIEASAQMVGLNLPEQYQEVSNSQNGTKPE